MMLITVDNEYLYYVQDDYSDTFTVSASGAPETVTFATNGNYRFLYISSWTRIPGTYKNRYYYVC